MIKLSHTQKEKYEQCPYKYYLHYVEGYRTYTTSSALAFGNALDVALNELLMGNEYHNVFDTEWCKYVDVPIDYYKSDLDVSLLIPEEMKLPIAKQNYLSLQRKGHKLLDAYKENIMPRIHKVESIQDEMVIVGHDEHGNETTDSIGGKLDLIAFIEADDKQVVRALLDNKTTSSPYAKNSVQTKGQLALYAQGYPDIEWFGYLTLNKKDFSTQVILDKISEDRKLEVLNEFVTVLHNINEGKFEKNTSGCFSFGRKCEFYTHCHRGYFDKHIYKKKD